MPLGISALASLERPHRAADSCSSSPGRATIAVFSSEDVEGISTTTVDLQPAHHVFRRPPNPRGRDRRRSAATATSWRGWPVAPAATPLFLFQLLDAFRETGTLEALPGSIKSLVAGEIDRLAPGDRTILRYAAVLGTSFDPTLLTDCVRDDVELDPDVWTRLSGLLALEPNGELQFRSTLMRDAAYEGLPYRRRRALHARVGATIEWTAGENVDEVVGILALHFHEAQRWDKALAFARAAGDRALGIYANVEATRFYGMALKAGRHLRSVTASDLARLQELSSDALYRIGEFAAADRALMAARRTLRSDSIQAGELTVKQAMISSRVDAYSQALRRMNRGLKALDGRRGTEAAATRARLMAMVAVTKFMQNHRVESIEWCRRAAREARRGDARDALAMAYKILDMALLENGQIEKAIYSGRALTIYEELGDLVNQAIVLNNLGLLEHDRSHWDASRALYQRALDQADAIGNRSMAALVKYNISEILIDQGRPDEAEPLLREVIRVWRAAGEDADVAEANRELAKALIRRGNLESAGRLLDQARAAQVKLHKDGEVLRTDARVAELLVVDGRGAEALKLIDSATRRSARTEGGSTVVPMLGRLRGWALLQLGHLDEAEATWTRALRSARRRRGSL